VIGLQQSQVALLAFLASSLSIIFAVLSYFINRNDDKVAMVVQYQLAVECANERKYKVPLPRRRRGTNNMKRAVSVRPGHITSVERDQLLEESGYTLKLSRALTQFWEIPDKSIEIGATVVGSRGAVTHIVHLMKREDLEEYADKISEHFQDLGMTAMSMIRNEYRERAEELNKIFRDHFSLSHDFTVRLEDRGLQAMLPHSVGLSSSTGSIPLRRIIHSAGQREDAEQMQFQVALERFLGAIDEETTLNDRKKKVIELVQEAIGEEVASSPSPLSLRMPPTTLSEAGDTECLMEDLQQAITMEDDNSE